MRRLAPLAAVLVGLALPQAAAAQDDGLFVPASYPAPMSVHSDGHDLSITRFDEFRPGPVRLHLAPTLGAAIAPAYAIVRLHDGVEAADAAAIDTLGMTDVRALEQVATLVSGVRLRPHHTQGIDRWFGPGRYAVLDQSGDRPYAAFEVAGAPREQRLRRPTARLRITDTGFSGPDRLDRRAVLRIDNRGERPHNVLSIRIRRGLTTAQAERKVRRGVDPERIGLARELLGVVSGGTSNRVLLDLQLPGRYLLASTYGAGEPGGRPDAARGLLRAVTVR